MRKIWIAGAAVLVAVAVYLGWYWTRDKVHGPGNLANPKLAELMNQQIDTWSTRNTGAGISETAQQGVNQWFSEIREVSIHYVETQPSKFSYSEAHFVLNNDSSFSHRCGQRGVLVIKLEFANGKATGAWTDGKERSADIDQAKRSLAEVVECIVYADMSRSAPNSHPDRYYRKLPLGKSPSEISNEWK
jgi:hypothetical protein